jgi:hypothetical protein
MDIPGNLFAGWRGGWRFLGAPDGAARESADSENDKTGHDIGIAAP